MSLKSGNCYNINIEKDISGVKYQIKKNKSRRVSFIRKKSRPMCQQSDCMGSAQLVTTRKVYGFIHSDWIDRELLDRSNEHSLTNWNCK